MLRLSNISHQFPETGTILNDLTMSVSDGEIVALLGASGCGKSTLLRLISGLLPLQTGNIELTSNSSFSFVFQEPSLMPWATVAENVALPLRIKKMPSSTAVTDVLKIMEIPDLAERYPSQISGGQKMRVSLARALAANPSLLLLDEPFAALDEILRFKMNDLILNLRETRRLSTVFVTHSIFEAAYLADRVLVICGGKIAGSVIPGLDRNSSAEDQRASAAFITASRRIAEMLGKGVA